MMFYAFARFATSRNATLQMALSNPHDFKVLTRQVRRRTRRIEGADWVRLIRCFVRTPDLNLKSVGSGPARVREAGPTRDAVH